MTALKQLTHLLKEIELIIISIYSSSGATSQNSYIFIYKEPHSKSLAAGILLRNELMLLDDDFMNDDLNTWLEFRESYLTEILNQQGDLVCAYCGKKHLEIGGKTKKDIFLNNKNPNLATIDHIIPLSKGGAKYDKQNLTIACRKCNHQKDNKSIEEFISEKNNKNL